MNVDDPLGINIKGYNGDGGYQAVHVGDVNDDLIEGYVELIGVGYVKFPLGVHRISLIGHSCDI